MNRLYDDLHKPSALATVQKLKKVTNKKKPGDIKEWLLKQDAYSLLGPVRKRFPNP